MSETVEEATEEQETAEVVVDVSGAAVVVEEFTEAEVRCEAETTVGGTLYRCALNEGHEDEHAFQPAAAEKPPADDAGKKMRQASERLDKENERHWNRIVEIMGDDSSGLVPCELCFEKTPGFRWNAAPNEQTATRVRVALGMPDLSNYAPSHWEGECDNCRGLGKVRTGSKIAKFEAMDCEACHGKGFKEMRPREHAPTEQLEEAPVSNGNPSWHDDGVQRDMFGTPITDPDYGLMPALRARPVDYWQTHRE